MAKLTMKALGLILVVLLISSLIGLVASSVTTEWHEFLGHTMVAKIAGCDARWWGNPYSGVTDFSCKSNSPILHILIAFGSIVVVFGISVALLLFAGDNSILKFLGFIGGFYSCMPSAFPLLRGSDMYYIVSKGFPVALAFIIYFIMSGVFIWFLLDEIMDKDTFKLGISTSGGK
jgi:hypothetical protein